MLKSLIGAAILVASIPTVGYLAAGLVCYLMGAANVPGYKIWRSGAARQDALAKRFGMVLGWVGQSIVSLCFAVVLVQIARLFFSHFEFWFLFRWIYWVVLFFLALGPSYRTLRVAEESSPDDEERLFYRYTLSFTCLTTALGFIALAFLPFGFV